MAEVIKSAIIRDRELFDLPMSEYVYEKDVLNTIVIRSIDIKEKIVEHDLKESGER